mmetsp:Transcript_113311/g.321258  ORF Transcript_113311/g.321258 Transcript_113311/m.321258 type:complete len:321 (+) Transcript_113311:413-1375(+)
MPRRAGVHGPDHELHLRQHRLRVVRPAADHVEHADALTVQAQVLGKGLAQEHLEAHPLEVAEGPRVLIQVTRRVALIRAVHQGDESPFLHEGGNLSPLRLARVDARRVVCAGMEEHHGARRRAAQGRHHALEVEAHGLGVPIRVGLHRQARALEDGGVVPPRRVGAPHLVRRCRQVRLHELRQHPQRASAREGLHGGDAPLADGRAVRPEREGLGEPLELPGAVDGGVLLVNGAPQVPQHVLLGLLHDLEDVGLALLRPVSSDAEVDLPRVLVCVVKLRRPQDRIDGRHRDVPEEGHRRRGVGPKGWARPRAKKGGQLRS